MRAEAAVLIVTTLAVVALVAGMAMLRRIDAAITIHCPPGHHSVTWFDGRNNVSCEKSVIARYAGVDGYE
jgi:hypothetical protein